MSIAVRQELNYEAASRVVPKFEMVANPFHLSPAPISHLAPRPLTTYCHPVMPNQSSSPSYLGLSPSPLNVHLRFRYCHYVNFNHHHRHLPLLFAFRLFLSLAPFIVSRTQYCHCGVVIIAIINFCLFSYPLFLFHFPFIFFSFFLVPVFSFRLSPSCSVLYCVIFSLGGMRLTSNGLPCLGNNSTARQTVYRNRGARRRADVRTLRT
ncbi:hypothetical protein F5B19DRAFT_187954 [Rostrohypoxylon terebratum]|nr:hypothetical protein F5B19DRAFT_187954 [Rostrohypoxylon terebratum]